MTVPYRILVADDQAIVRSGITLLVDSEPDLTVVGEAVDGAEAIALAYALQPDVILMDIRMPFVDGIEATRRIIRTSTTARILILTTYGQDEYLYEALVAGATGFLLKHAAPEELLLGIRAAMAGDCLVSAAMTATLIETFIHQRPSATATQSRQRAALTPRELEILTLVALGQSNAEIALRLFIADTTVKTHLARASAKIDARDRVQAVIWAYDSGLVRPGGPGAPPDAPAWKAPGR